MSQQPGSMPAMFEEARSQLEALAATVRAIEPALLTPEGAREALAIAAEVTRLGAGLELLVAPRAVAGAPWREEGYRSEAAWLAEATRRTVPKAISIMRSAGRIAELPATAEALREGRLSALEAEVLSAAATADPAAEGDLLDAAGDLPVHQFCRYATTLAHAAREGDAEHRAAVHARRFLRFWTDAEGQCRFSGGVSPDDGAEMFSAVRSMAAHMADELRRAGEESLPQHALDADALLALAVGDERRATFHGPEGGRSRRFQVVLHVDLAALRRGHTIEGERCEIAGVGPVPVSVATAVLGDALLKLVVADGVDVAAVTHLGRCVPAPVRTALAARDPTCVVPGCTVALNLEIDHWQVPWAEGGPSELWNLCHLCRFHHRLKTYDGYLLQGGPGTWEWLPPD